MLSTNLAAVSAMRRPVHEGQNPLSAKIQQAGFFRPGRRAHPFVVRSQASALARKRQSPLFLATARALQPHEAVSKHATRKIVPQLLLDIPRQLVLGVLTLVEKGLQILGQHLVQQRLLWHPALVGEGLVLRRDIHRTPYRSECAFCFLLCDFFEREKRRLHAALIEWDSGYTSDYPTLRSF
jgi:hypothetical protein